MESPHQLRGKTLWNLIPVIAAFLIGLFSLPSGLRLDDFAQGHHLSATLSGTDTSAWWDIFALADFEPGKRFSGAMPWWTVDGLHIRFFRPVAAASHLIDYAMCPESPWAMHAHSVAVHVLFVALVTTLYRRYFSAKKAAIAALIFAVSMIHASSVTWIANRNALLAGVFGVTTLLLYQDWCAGKRRGLLAIPSLAAALLSAEAGIVIFGLLFAVPLPENARNKKQPLGHHRWFSAAVLVAVAVLWRLLYSHYGFGAMGSGAYIDPLHSPALFLSLLPERLTWLVAMSVSPIRPLLDDSLPISLRTALGVLFAVASASVLYSARLRENRRWLAGALLSMVPLAASIPGERLLTISFIGLCPAIGSAALLSLQPSLWTRLTGLATGATHLLVSPALFILNALSFQPANPIGQQLGDVKSRNLVLISAPSVLNVTLLLESRVTNKLPRPAFVWYLWISEAPKFRRLGCCTLEVEDPHGHGREYFAAFFRGQNTPLEPGQKIKTLGYDVTIADVDGDGYATKARFEFQAPLEHSNLVFADWTGEDFERVPAGNL